MVKILRQCAEGTASLASKLMIIFLIWGTVILMSLSVIVFFLLPRFGNDEGWIFLFLGTVVFGGFLVTVGSIATVRIWHSAL